MTSSQISLLRAIAAAILDAVKAAGPLGAPAGVLYAALSAQGCTLSQFQQIMSGMVGGGLLRQDGDTYHLTGRAL